MIDFIIYFIALLITVPVIPTLLVYLVSFRINGHPWKSLHRAVNWTTCFYIIAVILLISIIFDLQSTGVILVLLLFLVALIIFIQWKTRTEIVFTKALRMVWRLSFLVFIFIYVCLLMIGILQQLLSS
ncbi:DUF3397 domain-containing protein [Virgibacillus ainsalahensis]